MTQSKEHDAESKLATKLEKELLEKHGQLLGGKDLQRALGYHSGDAFRQAVSRKTIPVPIFPIENRRGRFALACDIAKWLAKQRYASAS